MDEDECVSCLFERGSVCFCEGQISCTMKDNEEGEKHQKERKKKRTLMMKTFFFFFLSWCGEQGAKRRRAGVWRKGEQEKSTDLEGGVSGRKTTKKNQGFRSEECSLFFPVLLSLIVFELDLFSFFPSGLS